jgi:hypothetical protein
MTQDLGLFTNDEPGLSQRLQQISAPLHHQLPQTCFAFTHTHGKYHSSFLNTYLGMSQGKKCQCAFKGHTTDQTEDGGCNNNGHKLVSAFHETWREKKLILLCKPCSDEILAREKNPRQRAYCCTFAGQWDDWAAVDPEDRPSPNGETSRYQYKSR